MPAGVIEKWKTELVLQPEGQHPVELRRRIEEYLDAGHGGCWLRQPDVACLVEGALFHFDGQRYRLLAWCVMPNHVHALIETREGFPLADVLHSWKSFTSHKANGLLQRPGEFWQREYLDRYVRNAEHYEKVVAYIEENPVNAGLVRLKTDWPWSSARFRIPGSAAVPAAS
jgi:REP element-mobilizing transposase RayT